MVCFSYASLAVVSGVASFRSRWVNDLVFCGLNLHQYQVCVSLDTCFQELCVLKVFVVFVFVTRQPGSKPNFHIGANVTASLSYETILKEQKVDKK